MIFNEEYCKFLFKIIKSIDLLGKSTVKTEEFTYIININYGYEQDKKIIDLFFDIILKKNLVVALSFINDDCLKFSNIYEIKLNDSLLDFEYDVLYNEYAELIKNIDEIFFTNHKIIKNSKHLKMLFEKTNFIK